MFHKNSSPFIKRLISLSISLLFLLQTLQAANIKSNGANLSAGGKLELLAAYNVDSRERQVTHEDSMGDESEHQLDLEQKVVGTTLNTGSTTMSAGEHILLQSVTGKVNNLQLESSKVILESLNNVSLHTFDKTVQNGNQLTQTTTSQGDHVETVAGTDIIVSGQMMLNGQDITKQLYGGSLISQTPEQIKVDLETQLHSIVNQALQPTTQNEDGSYSGYDVSAIETLRTEGVDKHWNEETTSLNALGQLVVQAIVSIAVPQLGLQANGILGSGANALASTAVDAAVNSVISQVATAGLTAVLTGDLNLDVGEILTNAVKSAAFAGITDAIDTEYFVNKDTLNDNGVFDPEKLNFTENMSREVLQASVSSVVYGGDFKTNLIAAVGDGVAAPAFNYIGHELTGKEGLKLNSNDLSTQALVTTAHSLVGGTVAELTGGEFSSGAVATAVGHVVGEYMTSKEGIYGAIESGLTYDEFENQAIALGKAVGGATVLLTQEGVTDEELGRATALAGSVVENNSLKLAKMTWNVGSKLFDKFKKTGKKPTGKDVKDALRDELGDFVDNLTTLSDGQLTMDDAFAVIELASGFKIDGGDVTKLNKQITSRLGGTKVLNNVNANSKASIKTQYLYELKHKPTANTVKTGVTSGKVRKDLKTYRAEKQVRQHGKDNYESQIVGVVPLGPNARKKVLDIEIENANLHRPTLDDRLHTRP